jgi:hypothetical protein
LGADQCNSFIGQGVAHASPLKNRSSRHDIVSAAFKYEVIFLLHVSFFLQLACSNAASSGV